MYSKRTKVFENLPLLPLMAQVAETHIDTWKLLQPKLKYHIFITINDGKLWEQITDGMHVSICVSATCAISGKSGKCSNTFVRLEYKWSLLTDLWYSIILIYPSHNLKVILKRSAISAKQWFQLPLKPHQNLSIHLKRKHSSEYEKSQSNTNTDSQTTLMPLFSPPKKYTSTDPR